MYVSTKDMHSEEVKVRLREDDKKLLELLARRLGLKPAALARSLIVQALGQPSTNATDFTQQLGRG